MITSFKGDSFPEVLQMFRICTEKQYPAFSTTPATTIDHRVEGNREGVEITEGNRSVRLYRCNEEARPYSYIADTTNGHGTLTVFNGGKVKSFKGEWQPAASGHGDVFVGKKIKPQADLAHGLHAGAFMTKLGYVCE